MFTTAKSQSLLMYMISNLRMRTNVFFFFFFFHSNFDHVSHYQMKDVSRTPFCEVFYGDFSAVCKTRF